jgi:hypothetical protein
VLTTTTTTGSLMLLMPTTLSKQRSCGTCTTKNSYDVPSTTKTTALPMTFTSFRRLTPHQQAREQSTTSLRSHDVSGRSDTLITLSQPLRSMTVAPTQVYGSRCTSSQHAPLVAMKTTWRDTSPLVMRMAPLLWLSNLPAKCITSWATLSRLFTTNYQVTYN